MTVIAIGRRGRTKPLQIAALAAVALAMACASFVAIALPRGAQLWRFTTHAPYGSRKMIEIVTVRNPNRDEHIRGLSSNADGVRLTAATTRVGGRSVSLEPGTAGVDFPGSSVIKIRLSFKVTDCSVNMIYPPPVSLHLARLWIVHTITLTDHGTDFAGIDQACGD